ncbi:MAG TPA: DNA polymerase IV [Candidatus Methylacidiphilales bacterium]|nr:DNA polymerase IV [Candidatus Methylacidiphilales bacterium]
MRKIIHLDMDCFYAAVEMRERPELASQPIAVGGGARRGVVTTCNYEARKYGVRSAMPGFQARERCPNLVFLPVRFDLYRAESARIRRILREYTPLVEPLSLDEAYLDATGHNRYAWDIAREIRKRIFEETKLTSSAGIAPNKMLAKIASDWRKPNGQFAITPEQVDTFMRDLPVRKIWGVGPKSAEKFERQEIKTCGDLQKIPLAELMRRHGKWGQELYHLCRGHDDRPVEPNRIRKSLSNESTFAENLITLEQCQRELDRLVTDLEQELRAKSPDRPIHKAFVKVKFADFTRTTKECISAHPTREIYRYLLAEARARGAQPIRLLGAGVRFVEDEETADLAQPWLILEESKS